MKTLSALLIVFSILFGAQAFAQQIPNMNGNYAVVPGQCNFQGLGNVTNAVVSTANSANGTVIVLKLIGKFTGEVGFQTAPSRAANAVQQNNNQIQFFDVDVSISQVAIAITNTIHDEYADGHKTLEAVISLILTGSQLQFIANEGSGLQENCKFNRTN